MFILITMNCEIHFQEIRFVCRSDSCYYQPLCQSCLDQHSRRHRTNDLLMVGKAQQLASNNLAKQKETIEELLQPFARRRVLADKIEEQKKLLRKERDRLVRYIDDYIDQEVSRLTSENSSTILSGAEKQLERDLQEKMKEIEELFANYRRRPLDLQKALSLELEKFMEGLGKSHANLYGTTHFKYYSSLTHEIMLSRLELTAEKTTSRPFRKVMNESPLYFLIDPAYNSSPLISHFSPARQDLAVYNVEDQEWSVYHSKEMQIYEQGSLVHDTENSRFFWIGGIQGNRKSNSIVMYSLNQIDKSKRWRQLQLRSPRSSCMTSLVTINDLTGKPRSGILIVGGVGDNGEILKSCEFLDLTTLTVYPFGQTNFATFSGSLLVFNKSTVLRLGGLSKNKNDYSVVEVVQKLQVQDALLCYEREGKQPRWSYVQLELPKGEYLAEPRLFYANQAACQLNPNEVFVFGGLDAGMKGVTESYLVGLQEFAPPSREVKDRAKTKQQRFSVRWVNEKPLISGDDFGGLKPTIWKERLYSLQNIGTGEMISQQKRLLQFDMYQWYETESVLPQ